MREAAFALAALSDDFAPSLAARLGRALRDLADDLRRRRLAVRHLAHLRALDAAHLADVGLRPEDFIGLDPDLDARALTRRLAGCAETRRRARLAEDRWTRV